MLAKYGYIDFAATPFVLGSWLATLFVTLFLLAIYLRQRYLFAKPSIITLAFHNLIIQWPSALYAVFLQDYLAEPINMFVIVHLFAMITICLSYFIGQKAAARLWSRAFLNISAADVLSLRLVIWILGLLTLGLTALYMLYIPFSSTGLYIMFTDPIRAVFAREESLKLLPAPARYSMSFLSSAIVPLLVVVIYSFFIDRKKFPELRHRMETLIFSGFIFLGIFAVMLPGSRAAVVNILFAVLLAALWRSRLRIRPVFLMVSIPLILSPAILISVVREGRDLAEMGALVGSYSVNIAERIFLKTLDVDLWYLNYTEVHGPIGLRGFVRLAWLMGEESTDIRNTIGLTYGPQYLIGRLLDTVSATASYVFAQFTYFGLASLLFTIPATLLLDFVVLTFARLPVVLLIPYLAAIDRTLIALVQSDYPVLWMTHGFGISVLLVLILGEIINRTRTPAA